MPTEFVDKNEDREIVWKLMDSTEPVYSAGYKKYLDTDNH